MQIVIILILLRPTLEAFCVEIIFSVAAMHSGTDTKGSSLLRGWLKVGGGSKTGVVDKN